MGYQQDNDLDIDIDSKNKPSHFSYKQYKRRISKRRNDSFVVFISAFFIMLFVFLGLAKQLSPEIDVSIGSSEEITAETEGVQKGNIDDRLKKLQMEDKGEVAGDDEIFDTSLDEKVVLPKGHEQPTVEETKTPKLEDSKPALKEQKTAPTPSAEAQPKTEAPQTTAKVVVGYYSTPEQAEVAKGILEEAGLNVKPFIRNIGGAYTLQTGSFSTREAAQNAAAELLRNNFPARVIVE